MLRMSAVSVLVSVLVASTAGVYISWSPGEPQHKSNNIIEEEPAESPPASVHKTPFKDDMAVSRYLKLYGQDLMIWRCKNAIKPNLKEQKHSYIDLYCEVIGAMKSVEWLHADQLIPKAAKKGRYHQIVTPHHDQGRYYSRWIDFRLRVRRVTSQDSGPYTFKVTSPNGFTQQQVIHVDMSGIEPRLSKRRRARNKVPKGHRPQE